MILTPQVVIYQHIIFIWPGGNAAAAAALYPHFSSLSSDSASKLAAAAAADIPTSLAGKFNSAQINTLKIRNDDFDGPTTLTFICY